MKILNIMISKGLGGLEQAFLDYNESLIKQGYNLSVIYNKKGKIKSKFNTVNNIKYFPMTFFKPYFLLFPIYFCKILKIKPDLIILHNKKILTLFKTIGFLLKIPVVIVAHNQKIKLLDKADYIFSITQYQKDIFVSNNIDENKIFVIPNMITFKKDYKEFDSYSTNPPTFGIIGRFDPMKGFPFFVKSCALFKSEGFKFKAKIAGSYPPQYIKEYNKVKYLVKNCDLENDIEFTGWIDNKDEFYNNIDIFVLPSQYEPFGIVLLEAMMYGKPIISSLAEGPREIFKNDMDSVLTFEVNNEEELKEKMKLMINNVNLAKEKSKKGYELVNKKYTLEIVSKKLDEAIKTILKK